MSQIQENNTISHNDQKEHNLQNKANQAQHLKKTTDKNQNVVQGQVKEQENNTASQTNATKGKGTKKPKEVQINENVQRTTRSRSKNAPELVKEVQQLEKPKRQRSAPKEKTEKPKSAPKQTKAANKGKGKKNQKIPSEEQLNESLSKQLEEIQEKPEEPKESENKIGSESAEVAEQQKEVEQQDEERFENQQNADLDLDIDEQLNKSQHKQFIEENNETKDELPKDQYDLISKKQPEAQNEDEEPALEKQQ